jgi:predicted transcriptional regulator
MNKETYEWYFFKQQCEQTAYELEISLSSINNYLSNMVKTKTLIRDTRGLYKVNKFLVERIK